VFIDEVYLLHGIFPFESPRKREEKTRALFVIVPLHRAVPSFASSNRKMVLNKEQFPEQ
jgi:hypothetical protein